MTRKKNLYRPNNREKQDTGDSDSGGEETIVLHDTNDKKNIEMMDCAWDIREKLFEYVEKTGLPLIEILKVEDIMEIIQR